MTFKKAFFWLHFSIGLATGIFVIVIALTGTLLSFRSQISSFADRSLIHVHAPANKSPLTLAELEKGLHAQFPDKHIRGLSIARDGQRSVRVSWGREEPEIYVDPYTGKILGSASRITQFFAWVESVHRWFGVSPKLKEPASELKEWINVAFFVILLTGLILWWPRKVARFSSNLRGKAKDWNWHNVIGFWCLPYLFLISLSGIFMSVPAASKFLYMITKTRPSPNVRLPHSSGKEKHPKFDFDNALNEAKIRVPEWQLISIRLGKKDAAIQVFVESKGNGYLPSRSRLSVNPYDNSVLAWQAADAQSKGDRLRIFFRFLHTGEVAGLIGQGIAAVASLGAVILAFTGLRMAWHRIFKRRKEEHV